MQQNRSFGTLKGVRGFGDPHARTLSTGRSVFHQPDPLNPDGYELPFHLNAGIGLGPGRRVHRFPRLPNPTGSAQRASSECSTLPAPTVPIHQRVPRQESGTRPRRG